MKRNPNPRPSGKDDQQIQREQFNMLLRYNIKHIESEQLAERQDDEAFAAVASEFIRTMRRSLNINQARLSKSIGAAPNYISRVESGAVQPSVGRFLAILHQMGFDFVPELREDTNVQINMGRNGYTFEVTPADD